MILNNEKIIDELIEFLKRMKNDKCEVQNIEYGIQLEEAYKTLEAVYQQKSINIKIIFNDYDKKELR